MELILLHVGGGGGTSTFTVHVPLAGQVAGIGRGDRHAYRTSTCAGRIQSGSRARAADAASARCVGSSQ